MAKKVTVCALFAVLALAFSYLERLIPSPIPIPGIKLGLANIAVLAALYLFGARYALLINLTRIALSALLFGSLTSFVYSLCGGLLSFAVLYLLTRFRAFGPVGVSAAAGVAHNVGQLAAASVFLGSPAVWGYFPPLLLSGTVAGCVNGIIVWFAVGKLRPALAGTIAGANEDR